MYKHAPLPSGAATNPVIYGRFPKHFEQKSSAESLNKFLTCVLLWLTALSLVSYYFVSDGEKRMNVLGREIVALNNENIELQNKLDNLHSFNKVDEIIQGKTLLDTAKKIIEIPAADSLASLETKPAPVNFGWTIGY